MSVKFAWQNMLRRIASGGMSLGLAQDASSAFGASRRLWNAQPPVNQRTGAKPVIDMMGTPKSSTSKVTGCSSTTSGPAATT